MNRRVILSEKIAGIWIICYVSLVIVNTLISETYFIFKYGLNFSFRELFSKNLWNNTITLLNLILYLVLVYFSIALLKGDKKARRNIIKVSLFAVFIFFPSIIFLSYIIIGPHSLMLFVPAIFAYLFFLVILLLLTFREITIRIGKFMLKNR